MLDRLELSVVAGLHLPAEPSDYKNRGKVMPLLERGIAPTILLLDSASFGGSGDVQGVATLLANLEVAHYIVTRDVLDGAQPRSGPDHGDGRVQSIGRGLPNNTLPNVAWRELS